MALDEKAVLDNVTALAPEQRKNLMAQLPAVIDIADFDGLVRGFTTRASAPALRGFLLETTKALPPSEQAAAATEALKALPPAQQKSVQAEVFGAVIGGPGPHTRDTLWTIVVAGFSAVLVGSFLALAFGVFIKAEGKVQPELILAMFTSVVGFLAGLFVPSPGGQRSPQDTSQGAG